MLRGAQEGIEGHSKHANCFACFEAPAAKEASRFDPAVGR